MQQIALRLFDVDIFLETNSTTLFELFQRLYSEMAIPITAVRPDARRSHFVHAGSQTTLQIGEQQWQLPAPYPKFAHNLIWYDAVQQIQSHLLLHAAGVAYDGQGTLLVGHSMSGKTTLSLALMQRGARLLTDDALGIDYAKGELRALARQVQIRPKTYDLLNLSTPPIINPSPPYPLKNIFILGNANPQPTHQLLLDVQAAPQQWQQQLQSHATVEQFTLKNIADGWVRCQLRLTEAASRCYPAIEQLCSVHDVLIYDVQTSVEHKPLFSDEVVIRPIPPSQAAFQLLPHLQNRSLAHQFGGEIPLYTTTLQLLHNTNCYRLQVGAPKNTSDKVFELLVS